MASTTFGYLSCYGKLTDCGSRVLNWPLTLEQKVLKGVCWTIVAGNNDNNNCTHISSWWTPPAHRYWNQNPPMIGDDHITAGSPYTAVDCRRLSFSSQCCPHLERPAAPRHVRILSACFPKPSEDAPLLAFFFHKWLLSLLALIIFFY